MHLVRALSYALLRTLRRAALWCGAQVSWLRLHSQPTLACPLAADLVSAAAFQQQHGFPPTAYADWLAFCGESCLLAGYVDPGSDSQHMLLMLQQQQPQQQSEHHLSSSLHIMPTNCACLSGAGKKEASIAGASVGARTAAKLLGRYGGLEGVLSAAAAGELRGWGSAARQLLEDSSASGPGQREALLRRNLQLFEVNADPSVVAPRGWQRLTAALRRVQQDAVSDGGASRSGSNSGALPSQLVWQHPVHARRWRQLQQQLLDGAGPASGVAPQQLVTHEGFAIDGLVAAVDGGHASATLYACPCDVVPGSWPEAVDAVRQQASTAASNHEAVLVPLLNGASRHRLRLIKRAGHRVEVQMLLPQGLS